MTVLLVTSNADHGLLREGEPGHEALDAEFARRGIDARWVLWDDPEVDWAAADLVAVRSTWDYTSRWREFLAWAGTLDQTRLLNSAAIFAWNVDKSYLTRLPEHLVVPTVAADDEARVRAAVARFGPSVVKPRIGAGGEGLLVIGEPDDPRINTLGERPAVVQPLVDSVRTIGETSLYLFDGRPAAQFLKYPAEGSTEVRVNEEFGGRQEQVAVQPECVRLAREALEVARDWSGGEFPDYARVDFLFVEGHWRVSELELTEPGLYLDVTDANVGPFVDLVESRLG